MVDRKFNNSLLEKNNNIQLCWIENPDYLETFLILLEVANNPLQSNYHFISHCNLCTLDNMAIPSSGTHIYLKPHEALS